MRIPAIFTKIKKRFSPIPMNFKGRVKISANLAEFDFNGRHIKYTLSEKGVKMQKQSLRTSDLGLIGTTFFDEEYKALNVADSEVVDIGAATGDTAIYFIAKGAKKVYGYETDLNYVAIATQNVNLNSMAGLIKINGIAAPSLKDIIESNNLVNPVLKMDCEGCEYELISNAAIPELQAFKEMIIEYHNGYAELRNKLQEAGFDTSFIVTGEKFGMLYAKKE